MLPPLIISRADRIGDLVLSLPVLGLLKQVFPDILLHTSPYARAIGEWAQFNGLCKEVICHSNELTVQSKGSYWGLSLFHSKEGAKLFRELNIKESLGPRSRLSALWTYKKSVPQHRSRVEKSEMNYNLDLARDFLTWKKIKVPAFAGLEALKVPPHWTTRRPSCEWVIVTCNGASALNWPMSKYLEFIENIIDQAERVAILNNGHDAAERKMIFQKSKFFGHSKIEWIDEFADLKELIVFLSKAKRVLSSSSGPLHIAHAAGVRVHGLYPRIKVQSFDRWRPDGYWHQAPVSYEEI